MYRFFESIVPPLTFELNFSPAKTVADSPR
jgi:hypothetical protein